MMAANFVKALLVAGVAAGAAAGIFLPGGTAEARGGGGNRYYENSYKFDRMMQGYSGRSGPYWCDYKNLPDITCTTGKDGRERCKRTGWILRQHCY